MAVLVAAALLAAPWAHASGQGRPRPLAGEPLPLTLLLVLDRSGSMTGAPMEHMREACRDLVRRVRPQDRVGLIAFDQGAQLLLEPAPRADGRAAIQAIAKVQPGGGTAYGPALAMAKAALEKHPGPKGERRHVLLVSDGQSPRQGVLELVRALRKSGATLSTVALGASADQVFLAQMASAGSGRSYVVPDGKTLRALLARELGLVRQ